jgi:peptide/nickel transport system substrate-binding protein
MKLNVLSVNTYYNSGTQTGPPKGWGTTPWLNTPINITDWGSRPVPNVYLTSGLGTKGVWNAAHYSNKRFDALVKSFLASTSFKDENRYATKIAEILLHDTPVIFPYFYYSLAAGSKRVRGFKTDPLGDNYLSRTWLA